MIDEHTRKRWRRMFDAVWPGPFRFDPNHHGRIVATQGDKLMAEGTWACAIPAAAGEMFAEARTEWPRTLNVLEMTEAKLTAALNDYEVLYAKYTETLRATERIAVEMREDIASCEALGVAALDKAEIAIRQRDELALEVLRLRELETACRAWRKHRHSPNLVAAIDRILGAP